MRLMLISLLFACGEEEAQTQPEVEKVEQATYPKLEEVNQIAPDEDTTQEALESIKENLEEAKEGVDEIKEILKEETETQGE